MGIFAQTVDDYLKRDNLLKRTSNIIKYDFNENELMLIKEKLEERRTRKTLRLSSPQLTFSYTLFVFSYATSLCQIVSSFPS